MLDLPQHAAQVAIWRDLLQGTSEWQPLLHIDYFTPYLLGDGLALLLSSIMPVSAALKVVLTVAYYGFVGACVLLRQRVEGDKRLDWLFIPGFFGLAYALGFYEFLVAAPVGLLFILLACRYADRPAPGLAIVLCLADLALFFAHGLVFLFANAIGVGFLLLRQRQAAVALAALLPYAALGVWCLAYSLIHLGGEIDTPRGWLEIGWGWDFSRISSLVQPLAVFEADGLFTVISLLMFGAPFVLDARLNRHQTVAFVPISVTLLVWLAVPSLTMNASFIYQRFSLFILPFYALVFCQAGPMAGGSSQKPRYGVVKRLWLPLLCWAFLAMHAQRLLTFAQESVAFDEVLMATEPGHRALGLILDPASAATGHLYAYLHFPLWYQAEKSGFVDFNFAGLPPQIVRFRIGRAPVVTDRIALDAREFDWASHQAGIYRYFFVRHTAPLPAGYFPSGLCTPVLLRAAGPWSVFENLNCLSTLPLGTPPPRE